MITSYRAEIKGIYRGRESKTALRRDNTNKPSLVDFVFDRFDSISRIVFSEFNESDDVIRVHVLEPNGDEIQHIEKQGDEIVYTCGYINFNMFDVGYRIAQSLDNKIA